MASLIVTLAQALAIKYHGARRRNFCDKLYIEHPRQVFEMVNQLPGADDAMRAAAWLHDVVEDESDRASCDLLIKELIEGGSDPNEARDAITLVAELTNPSSFLLPFDAPRETKKHVDMRHLRNASVRAKRIKGCDCYCNLSECDDAPSRWLGKYLPEMVMKAEIIGEADTALRDKIYEKIIPLREKLKAKLDARTT